jgi:hypothetical protein
VRSPKFPPYRTIHHTTAPRTNAALLRLAVFIHPAKDRLEPTIYSVCALVMKPQDARVGMRVRVVDHHRIEERRGLVGKVVGRYGGEEHVVVDVRFPDGRQRLFWPDDLEEISSPRPWWRSLLGGQRGAREGGALSPPDRG